MDLRIIVGILLQASVCVISKLKKARRAAPLMPTRSLLAGTIVVLDLLHSKGEIALFVLFLFTD